MKGCLRILLVAILLPGVGVPAAQAVSLTGRSSTQALFYPDVYGKSQFDLSENLLVSARKFDPADSLRINAYGRVWGSVTGGGGVEGRLYYLYLDKKDLVKETDVRVGRQYFFVSAGSAIVDGARIDTRAIGPLAFTLIGGWEASYNYVYIGPQAHGTNESEGGNYVGGVQVSLATVPDTSLDLSWLVTYDDGDLAQSILGLAGSRRFGKYGELYGQLRYDLLSELFSEVTVGAKANVGPKLTLNGEYFYSVPVFDATSIYSVFAVDRFQQILLRADYVLSPKVTLNAEYRNENYEEGSAANVGEAGVTFRPMEGATVYAAGIWRVGTGGNVGGFELSGSKVFAKDYLAILGVQSDSFKREGMSGYDQGTRIWAGLEAKLTKNIALSGRIEDTISTEISKDVRARLALNVSF